MTHYPKNPHCPACARAKLRNPPRMPSKEGKEKTYSNFGDHVTADLKTVFQDKKSWGIDGQKCLLIICDAATGYLGAYPLVEKTADAIVTCFIDFAGDSKIKYIYCDGGPELVSAAKQINARYDTATPHCKRRNAIAEEKIKRSLYASRTLLEHSGLDPMYWPYSARAACTGMNVVAGTRSPTTL